jgi:hypothetical protein
VLARGQVAVLDPAPELLLLLGREQRDLVDLLEIRLQATFCGNGGLLGVGLGVLVAGSAVGFSAAR